MKLSLRDKCTNTEFFLLRIQSEYGKIRTRKTPYLDTFHTVHKRLQGHEEVEKTFAFILKEKTPRPEISHSNSKKKDLS